MAGKCDHGLKTRDCMVCASPKYGAETSDQWVTIPRARLSELEEMERVAEFLFDDGANQEKKRIRAELMQMHADVKGRHNYYHCAVVKLFGE